MILWPRAMGSNSSSQLLLRLQRSCTATDCADASVGADLASLFAPPVRLRSVHEVGLTGGPLDVISKAPIGTAGWRFRAKAPRYSTALAQSPLEALGGRTRRKMACSSQIRRFSCGTRACGRGGGFLLRSSAQERPTTPLGLGTVRAASLRTSATARWRCAHSSVFW